MQYFKVKEKCDNIRRGNTIYIKNELYTEKEVRKYNLNLDFLEKTEINKNKTVFMFGARFQVL